MLGGAFNSLTKEAVTDSIMFVRCDLQIAKLLIVDPKERLTAAEALQHPFFKREEVCVTTCTNLLINLFASL